MILNWNLHFLSVYFFAEVSLFLITALLENSKRCANIIGMDDVPTSLWWRFKLVTSASTLDFLCYDEFEIQETVSV